MTTRTRLAMLTCGLLGALALSACGGGDSAVGTSSTAQPQSTVNLVVTDTPSTGITVLSFQIQISSAILEPGNVALLPRPVTVDLAQLVSDTGFLASTVIDSGTYTSLELTYANPQITIQNNTAAAVTLGGQTCAVGATCTYTPALNNASVTISNGVFPITVSASSSTGLNLDLSIPDLLQSDLSVTFANGSSVNLSLLGTGPAHIDDVLATVTSVNGNELGVTTAFGDTLTLEETSTTAYGFPSSVCATPAASCLATGQIVALDLSLAGDGSLSVGSLSFVGAANASLVKGLVLSTATSGANPTAQLLLQRGINTASLSAGEIATVTLPANAAYGVATAAYPQIATATFASAQDLLPGQELIVSVGSDVVAGSAPTFSSDTVYLQASQVIGAVGAIDTAAASLTMDGLTGVFSNAHTLIQEIGVQTGASTDFIGLTSLSAVTAGELVVAKGPLFNSPSAGYPIVAATSLRARAQN
jgi:hypothetical protein